MTKYLKICAVTSMLGLLASSQLLAQSISEAAKIQELRKKSNEFIYQRDAVGVASLLDSEYQITTGSGELFQESPEEEANAWKQIFETYKDVIYVRSPETVEVSTYLPLASEVGTWKGSWTTPDGLKEFGGRYSASWKNIDGQWKIRSELFVTLYCNGNGC